MLQPTNQFAQGVIIRVAEARPRAWNFQPTPAELLNVVAAVSEDERCILSEINSNPVESRAEEVRKGICYRSKVILAALLLRQL
ncbi:hypothetical protein PM082_016393 [Marasmius tenuissimus]|nr:hypothetical protein PM082_016393 [Marasmius tenuissimus]